MAEFSPNSDRLAIVFGGSGFVGRHVVRALARDGWRIRVAVRRPDLAGFLRPLGVVGQIEPVQANLRYPDSIAAALEGADAVVNATGIQRQSGRQTYEAVHAAGAARLPAPRPRRASKRSSTSRASAPTRARPTPISPARGAARPPYARRRRARSSCVRRSSSARRTTSSTASARSRAPCRRCRCSAAARPSCSRCSSATSRWRRSPSSATRAQPGALTNSAGRKF